MNEASHLYCYYVCQREFMAGSNDVVGGRPTATREEGVSSPHLFTAQTHQFGFASLRRHRSCTHTPPQPSSEALPSRPHRLS